jgi:hypothetical protein
VPTAPKLVIPKTSPPFKSWSFTRYADWAKCPRFANAKHNIKIILEEKSPAMLRGGQIAQASEDYLTGKTKKLHKELQTFEEEYKFYKQQKTLFVEESWGFTEKWEPCSSTDWNRCKLRVKIDIGYLDVEDSEVHIRDGKTGKFREYDVHNYVLQLDLYVAAAVNMYPDYNFFIPRLNYTDLGITYPDGEVVPDLVFTAAEARKKQKEWDRRIKPMMADTRFPPRPGRHCQWCQLSKQKGGPCEY